MAEVGGWKALSDSRENSAPKPRSSHSVVCYDHKVYVFGGEFIPRNPIDNDVFVFDVKQNEWSTLEVSGRRPSARVGHDAAIASGKMFVFGGRLGVSQDSTSLNDLWALDLKTRTWEEIQTNDSKEGPQKRSYHAMTSSESSVFVFGGCGVNGRLNDVWQFDTNSNRWDEIIGEGQAPTPRGGPGFSFLNGNLYIFGGFNGKELQDFHVFDLQLKKWNQPILSGEIPYPRSVAFLRPIKNQYLFIFGGEADPSDKGHEGAGEYHGDSYILNTKDFSWQKVSDSNSPCARGWHQGASLDKNSVVIFGGFDGDDRRNDLYVWTQE